MLLLLETNALTFTFPPSLPEYSKHGKLKNWQLLNVFCKINLSKNKNYNFLCTHLDKRGKMLYDSYLLSYFLVEFVELSRSWINIRCSNFSCHFVYKEFNLVIIVNKRIKFAEYLCDNTMWRRSCDNNIFIKFETIYKSSFIYFLL